MTEPITDEKFYNEHAALLGHVAARVERLP